MTTKTAISKAEPANPKASRQRIEASFISGKVPTYASVLIMILRREFEDFEFLNWEHDVLIEEIKSVWKVTPSYSADNQIAAMITALTTEGFYRDPLVFNHIANALSGGPVPMEQFELATLEEMAWAVVEVLSLDTDVESDVSFAPEVKAFVGAALANAGQHPFAPLDFSDDVKPTGFANLDPEMVSADIDQAAEERVQILSAVKADLRNAREQLSQIGIHPNKKDRSQRY